MMYCLLVAEEAIGWLDCTTNAPAPTPPRVNPSDVLPTLPLWNTTVVVNPFTPMSIQDTV